MATWYETAKEAKEKLSGKPFEEYWITEEDIKKLKNKEPIRKGWLVFKGLFQMMGDINTNKEDRRIILHIGKLNHEFECDDPVILILQHGYPQE